jgi:hypothetical protein
MSTDNRTSNALGVPIPVWIVKQLEKRSKELSVENGASNDNLLFRANRSSWVRMVSSVDIRKDELNDKPTTKEFIRGKADSALAKEYVLQAGISKYVSGPGDKFSYALRNGFEDTYNPLGYGVDKYGYRPMPGITSVKVTTQGRLGSIRSAEIQLKAWTKDQLDIIDTLYFKLGFTMFLEWGHTYYYDQDSTDGELKSSEDLSIDPFKIGLKKEDIYSQISSNVQKSKGNYDAMLGMVTNFNFTYNQEGGYDCTIRLIALGALMSQMKINNPKELPEILASTVKQLINTLEIVAAQQRAADLAKAQDAAAAAYVAAGIPDAKEIQTYPACVRIINNEYSRIVEVKPIGALKPLKDRGIIYDNKGQNIILYENGKYNTSDLKKNGSYTCGNDDKTIIIDGSGPGNSATYKAFVTDAKTTVPSYPQYVNSLSALPISAKGRDNLDKPYAYIVENNGKEYYAINDLKAVVPKTTDDLSANNAKATISFPTFFSKLTAASQYSQNQTADILIDSKISDPLIVSTPKDAKIYKNLRVNLSGGKVQQVVSSFTTFFGGPAITYSALQYSNTLLQSNNEIQSYSIGLSIGRGRVITEPSGKNINALEIQKDYPKKEDVNKIFSAISQLLRDTSQSWDIVDIEKEYLPDNLIAEVYRGENEQKLRIHLQKKITVPDLTYSYYSQAVVTPTGENIPAGFYKAVSAVEFKIDIFTNDIGILKTIDIDLDGLDIIDTVSEQQTAQNTVTETPPEPPPPAINASEVQKAEAARYRSAFEIMVRTIQLYSLNSAIVSNSKKVSILKLLETNTLTKLTNKLFQIGLFGPQKNSKTSILTSVIELIANKKKLEAECNKYDQAILAGETINEDLMLVRYAFGFHFGLLGGKTTAKELFSKQLYVDYDSLMTSYVVPYEFNQSIFQGATVNHPVYIPLGLVIMLLNHMCTIYDKDRPIVYIDFNSKTNICLSTPEHLSTNPYEVLIPFQGSNTDFKNIIDPSTIQGSNIKAQPEDSESSPTPIYTPQGTSGTSDAISGGLLPFKQITADKKDAYRGRTLNILISCDYILETVIRFAKNNDSGDVYLKEFLEELLSNVNKSLGDINVFRVAYDDSANTIHIVDDQTTPNLEDKYPEAELSTTKAEFNSRLPLFGKGTVARSLEVKTEISSKLSNMIAISSNAKEDQSNLSKSTQQFGIYTQNYQDRYANNKTEYSSSIVASPTNTQIKSAVQFNNSITSFYGDAIPAIDSVAAATGYYIQRMSKLKGKSTATNAAPMIPVSLNFSMDGMSGFGMGQSFTVDPEFLPYSYNLSNPGDPRTVAFVMIGLDHTIEGNLWTSNVRTNMIYGKKGADFEKDELRKLSATSDLRRATVSGVGSTSISITSVPDNSSGCKRVKGFIDEQIVASTKVKSVYGSFIQGKPSFISKIEAAVNELKAQNITITIGDNYRSFSTQKAAYEQFLINTQLYKEGKSWVKNGVTYSANKKPDNIASPCSGYHVIGQAIDLEQTTEQKNDILAEGPIYKALYNQGLRRISNEWWHWSLGEV